MPFARVRAVDDSWNIQTSITHSISLASSDGSATLPGPFALTGGEANVSVTANAAGTFTVSAEDLTDGTIPIASEEIQERLREQGKRAKRYRHRRGLRRLVEDQVRFELLAQAALERGLDRDPDVVREARKVMVRKLLDRDLTHPQATISALQIFGQEFARVEEEEKKN